uniref:Uncharacterized protein n=1 Tax=Rhizophora mucronata TaxID=61149 RepID=A0A2P2M8R6_RHIMU
MFQQGRHGETAPICHWNIKGNLLNDVSPSLFLGMLTNLSVLHSANGRLVFV